MKMRESKGLKATASVLLAVFLSALAVGLSGLYTLLVYYRVWTQTASGIPTLLPAG